MAETRHATATWSGNLTEGSGMLQYISSGAFSRMPITWGSRTAAHEGRTSPEELLAAAHAGCFAMALSHQLAQAGLTAESLDATCTITLDQKDGGFAITESHLELKAKVPGATQAAFDQAAQAAKTGCPVSKLYNTNITLDAKLES